MRTQEEIVARIKEKMKESISFEPEVLFPYLSYKNAKQFLKTDRVAVVTTKEEWDRDAPKYTKAVVLKEAQTYMEQYGWPKCQEHRGLSASRTLMKMEAWAWLLGDDALVEKVEEVMSTQYAQYGAPILKAICEHYCWPIPDDEATQRMMRGEPCGAAYECGCGL